MDKGPDRKGIPSRHRPALLPKETCMNMRSALASVGARGLKTRWLVRAPIWLYRAGLGFVFGARLLMLEHTGRSSGARRYVVLEVIEHPARDEYVVVAGFGRHSHWYRNVLANASVRVSCGFRRSMAATAIPMTADESATTLRRYAERHPRAWANLGATIEIAVGHPVDDLPMMRLQLNRTQPEPPH